MEQLFITIAAIRQETDEAKTFFFTPNHPLQYKAGQFITLVKRNGEKELRRNYSFSSSPAEEGIYSFTLKRVANGEFSRWLFDEVKVGDTVEILSPAGMFSMPGNIDDKESQLMLFAAGGGITPIFSIIKSMLIDRPQLKLLLVYSNTSPEKTIFKKQLEELQQKNADQLLIQWLYSSNTDIRQSRLSKFLLEELIKGHKKKDWNSIYVFACGPYAYMQTIRIVFFTGGLPAKNFRQEQFIIPDALPAERRYFDTNNRTIHILFQGKVYQLEVPFNQSILDAALVAGIQLPYSCHAGRCSACKCKIVSGKIWMHYNEVLTDADEAEGWGLTCTGHPASDGLKIIFDD